jgi:hypothetical protein
MNEYGTQKTDKILKSRSDYEKDRPNLKITVQALKLIPPAWNP